MTEKLQNIIKEEVMKLPKEGQEAINALDWVKITEEIGKQFSLSEDEITNFQVETLLILTGIEYPESYVNNIEDNVGVTKDDANKIANEALQKIFTPINNIFVENIKKSGKVQNAKPEQNLDFILSGGDYSAFMSVPPPLDKGRNEEGFLNSTEPLPNPLLVKERGNKIIIPVFSIKDENLKNRFTI